MSVSGFRLAENGGDDIRTPNEVILCSNGSNSFRLPTRSAVSSCCIEREAVVFNMQKRNDVVSKASHRSLPFKHAHFTYKRIRRFVWVHSELSRVFLKGPVHELINLEHHWFNAAKSSVLYFKELVS